MIKKNKRRITALIVFAMVSLLTVGLTLAYLRDVTETKKNVFTSDKKITLLLREPLWDGYDFEDENTSNGAKPKPGITGDALKALGVEKAANYLPGDVIPKNPMVKNSGEENGVSIYTALKVQYFDEQGEELTYNEFKSNYLEESGIEFSERWKDISDSDGKAQMFLYDTILGYKGDSVNKESISEALFTQVPLSYLLDAGPNGELPKFHIKVCAYAVQAANVDVAMAETELKTMMKQ